MHTKTFDKSKPTNILSPNRYQLLEPTSENFELVSGNFQNTLHYKMHYVYREMKMNNIETEMYLILKVLEAKDLLISKKHFDIY